MGNLGRWLVASAVLALGGCQCLEPVSEVTDAGLPDAGPGDGGVQPQCSAAADCGGALPAQSLCSFGIDAGFSCIDQRCVFECSPGRACGFDAGASCLDCAAPPGTACADLGCGAVTIQGQVEGSSCEVGFTDVVLQPLGGCRWSVSELGGSSGVVTRLGAGEYVGQFSGLGTCVGISLFTQVERVLFSCEGCQFVLRI